MRTLISVIVVACCACGIDSKRTGTTTEALSCDEGQTVVYAPRFLPVSGASGVASAEDAAAGYVSSDAKGYGPTAVSDGGTLAPEDLTAMTTTCGESQCAPGEVVVSIPPPAAGYGTAGGLGDFDADVDAPPPPPTPEPDPAPTTKCAPPAPACPAGLSPQYSLTKSIWECTDCSLVVTYGGIFGNYRRCVSSPTITCPAEQVPTYSYEGEIWECKPTCDNGLYDQHTISGQLVCVPC